MAESSAYQEPSPIEAAPSPPRLRAFLFAALFTLSAFYLLEPLWGGGMPPAAGPPDASRAKEHEFAENFILTHITKSAIGLRRLGQLLPGSPIEDSVDELGEEIGRLAKKARSPRSLANHMIAARYLYAKDAEEIAFARWLAFPEPLDPDQARERHLLYQFFSEDEAFSEEDAAWLRKRLGLYGRLAEAVSLEWEGSPAAEARKSEIEAESFAYLLRLLGVASAFAGCALAGAILLLVFLAKFNAGALRLALDAPRLAPALFFETFTIYLAFMAGLSALSDWLGRGSMLRAAALELSAFVIALYPLLQGAARGDLRRDLGLTRGRGVGAEVGCGALGYMASLPLVGVGVIIINVLFVHWLGFDLMEGMHPIVPLVTGNLGPQGTRALVVVLAVVIAPLVEELMFRGFLYRALRARWRAGPSIFLSALLFASIHPQGVMGIPLLFAIGVVLGALREWRGSLIAPIAAHACVNGVTMAVLLVVF